MPEAPPEASHGGHPLWGPLVASGILAVAGAATAVIAGVYFKKQAQDSADQSYQNIVTAAKMRGIDRKGLCNSPPTMAFQQACAQYANNNNQVDQDATIGNIGVVVAIAGAVGTLVFSLIRVDDDRIAAPSMPVVRPVVGPSFGGLTLAGKF
jgi:hypothetical protein